MGFCQLLGFGEVSGCQEPVSCVNGACYFLTGGLPEGWKEQHW